MYHRKRKEKKMWYIYTMEYYLAVKKNEIMPFAATWMQLEILILSEVSQKEKDKYHMISLTCGISNMTQTNLSMKQTNLSMKLRDIENRLWLLGWGGGWGRDGVGGWG